MRTPWTLLMIALLVTAPLAIADDDGDANETKEEDLHNETKEGDLENETREEDVVKDESEDEPKDEKGEDDDGKDADEVERKVKVEVSEDEALIKLGRESGSSEDEVKIQYVAPEGSMKVEYELKNATLETATELKVRFLEAVEFVDNDSDGAFDPKDEEVVQRVHRERMAWALHDAEPVWAGENLTGTKLSGTGTLPGGQGNVTFVLYVYGDFVDVNGTSLRPTDVKIDVLVEDWPYQHDASQVALLFKTEQEAKLETEGDDDAGAEGVSATANGFTAYFTWAEEALVDGTMRPVRTTMVESEDKNETKDDESKEKAERKFWFSYARGAAINHDPVLGVASAGSAPTASGSPAPSGGGDATGAGATTNATPALGAALAVAAVAVVAFVARRR